MSLSSISRDLGMSRDRTRNLERSAIEAIRNSSRDLQVYLAG
jgi:RNA polymerase nonessential primary-like sigma factor